MSGDGINDEVTLILNGETILKATGFDIHQSILQQPGEFSVRLGQGPSIRDLLRKFPPNTPFQLKINDTLRMTGHTDGRRASSAGGQATELTIFGRDTLAPLHDAHIDNEISFKDDTYKGLTEKVLKIVGLDPSKLKTSGVNADRKLKTGVSVRELLPVQTVEEILKGTDGGMTAGSTHQSLQSKLGERWMEFLRKQYDRAGLFLWGGGDGTIYLSAPNSALSPTYRILRRRGQTRNEVNVIHADYLDDTRPRYSFAKVYGKHRSAKTGSGKSIGDSTDDVMLNYGYGISRALVVRDAHCQNNAQAAYLAQRKLAEGRRHGFQLVYTVAGLSTTSTSGSRAVWTPDTVVEVFDEEYDINGETFWIDSVDFRRSPHTTTTIRMMHTYDVVFGTPDFEGASGAGVKTGFKVPQTASQISSGKK